jgi:hypothetical protein
METSRGNFLQTHSGILFFPLDPRPEDIDVGDIAHSLSLQCRFAGHVKRHYSVAEHSIRVSKIVSRDVALWALLHDASEAYLVDLPRPLKVLPEFYRYREIEKNIMDAIVRKYGLCEIMPEEVDYADNVLLATEARDLMGGINGLDLPEPLGEVIIPWNQHTAEMAFLATFSELIRTNGKARA